MITLADMDMRIKFFAELDASELYEILRLRSEVFVVEQNCVYQDIDGIDTRALHVYAMHEGKCIGCLRVFERDKKTVQIGRVVTAAMRRGTGLGRMLMLEALRILDDYFHGCSAYLEAQTYAVGFYSRFGFKVASEVFLEDGIPHVVMTND